VTDTTSTLRPLRGRALLIALLLGAFAAVAVLPVNGASAVNGRLSCDVRPVILGHGPADGGGDLVWAYALDTDEVLWEYTLTLNGGGFSPVDIGQDPYGRLYLSSGSSIYTLAAGGTADDAFDPGSGAVTLVAEITLAGETINDRMLAFDRFGKGYFIDEDGDFLVRFDPQATPVVGAIAGEKFAVGLQAAGLPSGTASGDVFIANSLAYILWDDDDTGDIVLVRAGLTAGATDYAWDGTAGVIGPVLDPDGDGVDGFGVGASGGRVFVGGAGDVIHELRLFSTTPVLGEPITVPSSVFGLTGNGEAVFDDCFAFGASTAAPAPHPMELSCSPDPVAVGGTVTCEITGGDPGIDILWRATFGGAVVATRGVTLDDQGNGTFTFTAPASASGLRIDVELVEWDPVDDVGVTGMVAPSRIPAGEGRPQGPGGPLAVTLALAVVGAIVAARLSTAGVDR
jgi:hypothetical protein